MSEQTGAGPAAAEAAEADEQERYQDPAELTGFEKSGGGPAFFNRKKVMVTLCCVFAAVVILGFVFSANKSKKKQTGEESASAARAPREFLRGELDKSLQTKPGAESGAEFSEGQQAEAAEAADGAELPKAVSVSLSESRAAELSRDSQNAAPKDSRAPPPPASGGGGGGGSGGGQEKPFTAHLSSLVPPVIEGSLFSGGAGTRQAGAATYAEQFPYLTPGQGQGQPAYPAYPYASLPGQQPASYPAPADPYAAQNGQAAKNAFYGSASGGSLTGVFLGDNLLWIGTIIPAVLETAVNTDLPGNVIARVSENIYDSRTGKKLLVPQGSTLVAKYNSSVSYAQSRVQIVWDVLIRPDGYQIELEGMNGIDSRGMAGIKAEYHENWFEYIKAAGIISMFSMANSKMVEETAKYGSNEMAAGVASSNAQFVNQTGASIVARALDVQPTLTVDSGEKISVMVNKTLYLPPLAGYPVQQKYVLK
jgi:type IV secretion system protein VirB10